MDISDSEDEDGKSKSKSKGKKTAKDGEVDNDEEKADGQEGAAAEPARVSSLATTKVRYAFYFKYAQSLMATSTFRS